MDGKGTVGKGCGRRVWAILLFALAGTCLALAELESNVWPELW